MVLVLSLGFPPCLVHATGTQTFSDGTFNPSDWELIIFTAGPGGGAAVNQESSGGNPDHWERVVTTLLADSTVVGFRGRLAATYNPQTQGAIESLDYSEDYKLNSGFGQGQANGPALKQDGKVYAHVETITGTDPAWKTLDLSGLGAGAFVLVTAAGTGNGFFDFSQHPNFSTCGSTIEFGFFRNNDASGVGYSIDAGIDNWSVTLHPVGSVAAFCDGTFADTDWTAAKIVDTTAGQGATFTAAQFAAGGNPGAYRHVAHTYDTGLIEVAHLRNGAIYDPAIKGRISAIQYAYDLIHFSPPPTQAVEYQPLVYQNGSYYAGPGDLIFSEAWTSFGNKLSASDFSLVSGAGPTVLDFSASAPALQFGFVSSNSSDGGLLHRESGIDNWTVSVTNVLTLQVDTTHLFWNSVVPLGAYDVVRGDLVILRGSGADFTAALDAISPPSDVCMADNTPSLSVMDTKANPPLGGGWLYLVRCDGGSYDSGSPRQVGDRDPEILAAASECP